MEKNEIPKEQKKILKNEWGVSKNNLYKEEKKFFEKEWIFLEGGPKFLEEKGNFPKEQYTFFKE
jgi:hypothetical protein